MRSCSRCCQSRRCIGRRCVGRRCVGRRRHAHTPTRTCPHNCARPCPCICPRPCICPCTHPLSLRLTNQRLRWRPLTGRRLRLRRWKLVLTLNRLRRLALGRLGRHGSWPRVRSPRRQHPWAGPQRLQKCGKYGLYRVADGEAGQRHHAPLAGLADAAAGRALLRKLVDVPVAAAGAGKRGKVQAEVQKVWTCMGMLGHHPGCTHLKPVNCQGAAARISPHTCSALVPHLPLVHEGAVRLVVHVADAPGARRRQLGRHLRP